MSVNTKNAEDLQHLMESNRLTGPGLCRVIIRNQTPPDWQLTIIEIGTKFFYRDGKDFIDGPIPTNIGSGGETTTQNNNPNECVFQEQTFIKVVVPGEAPAILQGTGTCPAGQCLIQFSHTIVPKSSVAEADIKSKDILKFLELRAEQIHL